MRCILILSQFSIQISGPEGTHCDDFDWHQTAILSSPAAPLWPVALAEIAPIEILGQARICYLQLDKRHFFRPLIYY
jgi:hypothetical protein